MALALSSALRLGRLSTGLDNGHPRHSKQPLKAAPSTAISAVSGDSVFRRGCPASRRKHRPWERLALTNNVAQNFAVPCTGFRPSGRVAFNVVCVGSTISPEQQVLADVVDLGGGRSLSYELVLGPLVRYTSERKGTNRNTAVLIHGIMGSGRNMASFTRKLAHALPSWQFLLVDLRHHGKSVFQGTGSPNTVDAAARDVLDLVMKLKLFPRMLIGHSFGGKMVLSMLKQAKKPLPMHIQAWVLDAQPGELYLPKGGADSPEELIDTLIHHVPIPVMSKRDLVTRLKHFGFSSHVSQWVATNLRFRNGVNDTEGFSWVFHLPGIYEMFHSYKTSNYWDVVEKPISGVHIHFLRGANSDFRWPVRDVERLLAVAHKSDGISHAAALHQSGVSFHVLEGAGHWVHADNPDGLYRLLEPSFGVYDDTVII